MAWWAPFAVSSVGRLWGHDFDVIDDGGNTVDARDCLLRDLFEVLAREVSPERCDPITAHAVNLTQRGIGALPHSAPGRCHNPFRHGEASYSGSGAFPPGWFRTARWHGRCI